MQVKTSSGFGIVTDERTYYMYSGSEDYAAIWVEKLKELCDTIAKVTVERQKTRVKKDNVPQIDAARLSMRLPSTSESIMYEPVKEEQCQDVGVIYEETTGEKEDKPSRPPKPSGEAPEPPANLEPEPAADGELYDDIEQAGTALDQQQLYEDVEKVAGAGNDMGGTQTGRLSRDMSMVDSGSEDEDIYAAIAESGEMPPLPPRGYVDTNENPDSAAGNDDLYDGVEEFQKDAVAVIDSGEMQGTASKEYEVNTCQTNQAQQDLYDDVAAPAFGQNGGLAEDVYEVPEAVHQAASQSLENEQELSQTSSSSEVQLAAAEVEEEGGDELANSGELTPDSQDREDSTTAEAWSGTVSSEDNDSQQDAPVEAEKPKPQPRGAKPPKAAKPSPGPKPPLAPKPKPGAKPLLASKPNTASTQSRRANADDGEDTTHPDYAIIDPARKSGGGEAAKNQPAKPADKPKPKPKPANNTKAAQKMADTEAQMKAERERRLDEYKKEEERKKREDEERDLRRKQEIERIEARVRKRLEEEARQLEVEARELEEMEDAENDEADAEAMAMEEEEIKRQQKLMAFLERDREKRERLNAEKARKEKDEAERLRQEEEWLRQRRADQQ